jgi:hypothetical protein
MAEKTGEKQEVVVTGNPLAKDDGTIAVVYNPGPGDPDQTEVFGKKVFAGESVDVPAKHAEKIRGNPYLSVKGEKPDNKLTAPEPEEQEEATFDDNVARERSAEYLEGQVQFANSMPGEADRVARAQQMAAELKEAQESDDTDKPRRGRPPKAK